MSTRGNDNGSTRRPKKKTTQERAKKRKKRVTRKPTGKKEPEAPVPAASSASMPASVPPAPAHGPAVTRLPEGYGRDCIGALVRDPRCIYVYWDLTGGAFAQVVRERGEEFVHACHWALRVNDQTHTRHRLQPIAVEAGNWYLDVEPGTSYSVDIGLSAPDGAFVAIASSNVVATPRDCVSDRIDEEWVVSESDFERMFDLSGGNRTLGASESISSVGLHKMRERIALHLKQAGGSGQGKR